MDLIAEQCLHRRNGIAHGDQLGVQTFALIEAFLQGDERRQKLHVGRRIGAANDFRADAYAAAREPGRD